MPHSQQKATRPGALLAALVLAGAPVFGQSLAAPPESTPAEPVSSAPGPALETSAPADLAPRVVAAAPLEKAGLRRGLVILDDTLVVRVQGFRSWLGGRRCDEIRLVLDGLDIQEMRPRRCKLEEGEVWFLLRRIDRAREPAWQSLLPERQGLGTLADVSVALTGEAPLPTDVQDDQALPLAIADFHSVVGAMAFLVVTLLGLGVLAQRTAMLRQPGEESVPVRQRPFSLARVQVAWWFYLVLAAFLLISILVGDMAVIPSSVLGLLGIASGTYLGAEVIDKGKTEPAPAAAAVPSAEAPATRTVSEPALRTSRGLLLDLLSDGSGIAFYRFQIFIWTLVLGWFFISSVWQNLTMPDLPSSLLGLMGISGGTFLGMKLPEKVAGG